MKHAYAELFTAKLNDTSLVLFEKHEEWKEWREVTKSDLAFAVGGNFEYFLCLPKHKETVLNSLNGGIAQFESPREKGYHALEQADWSSSEWYMQEDATSRIKPKKESRWIAVNPDGYVMPIHTVSIESAREHASSDTSRLTLGVQFIEIEIEVAG